MDTKIPRRSTGPFAPTDLGEGLSTKAKPPIPPSGPLKPEHSQASRALGLASYFASGCMAYVSFSKTLEK